MTRACALVMGLAVAATLVAAPGCKKKEEAKPEPVKAAPAEPAPTPDKPET